MKERPILFSAPMVRAIRAGTKTQTRREFKAKNGGLWPNLNDRPGMRQLLRECKFGQPGDRLWVRERLGYCSEYGHFYAADRTFLCSVFDDEEKETGYSYECQLREASVPSIHLPRRWSRLALEITDVRVERLQDISEADALAEGIAPAGDGNGFQLADTTHYTGNPRDSYFSLWDAINGQGAVEANPWVWVIEFAAHPSNPPTAASTPAAAP
jgi:hypothetical protein